ncbi:MAG TPA: hypothetical protein VFK85_01715 [Anaeromyxobacteraceae bacterium]|nr:hypothetical protein [Anaeromyxobacteraceae bacterium]
MNERALGSNRRDEVALRRVRDRQDLGCDRLGVTLRAVEESRQGPEAVLGCDHLREGGERADAEPSVSQGVEHFRIPLQQLRGDLAVIRAAVRQAEVANEELEEVRVPELEPTAPSVELGERDHEIRERAALPTEQLCEAYGEVACGGHHLNI